MRKYSLTLMVFLFLSLISGTGVLQCQEKEQMLDAQYRSVYVEKSPEKEIEDINAKNIGVRMLEATLKYHISKRYQKIYTEELIDRLENRRDQ